MKYFSWHRWLQYITRSEASHIPSDILILFLILLDISFFALHEKDIHKISYLSLSHQISNRISVRVSGSLMVHYLDTFHYIFLVRYSTFSSSICLPLYVLPLLYVISNLSMLCHSHEFIVEGELMERRVVQQKEEISCLYCHEITIVLFQSSQFRFAYISFVEKSQRLPGPF